MASEVFPFRYRHERTGKWTRARYKATREEISARYKGREIDGPAEIRGDSWGGGFRPFGPLVTHAELMRIEEQAPDMAPGPNDEEREFTRLFLRRYVPWRARSRRLDHIDGAARLYQRLGDASPGDPER